MYSFKMLSHFKMAVWFGVAGTIMLVTLISRPSDAIASFAETSSQLPPGFATTIIAQGLVLPTDMDLLPNGDLLIIEKGVGEGNEGLAQVRLVRNGVLQPHPVLMLSLNVQKDSGLLGVVVDPDFANNRNFYLWYATGANSYHSDGIPDYRLSRFTLDVATGRADSASETIILSGVPWSDTHGGGGLVFDAQGNLYISTGDARDREAPQDLRTLAGKVLRIRPSHLGYSIPQDNPYRETPEARAEIYALGLRNPFRMTRHSNGRILVGDVGDEDWEEIDLVKAGADYGWPEREGPCRRGSGRPCAPAPAQYTDPALTYRHDGGGAVTALAFYEGEGFPAEYRDHLFYADLDQATISAADLSDTDFTIRPFASGMPGIVDLAYANNGLYYLDIYRGELGLIYHSNSVQQPPQAKLSVGNAFGPSPLTVNLSAAGSSDPNGLALRYHWDFGDGSAPVVKTAPNISYQYVADGTYTVRLKVSNLLDGESSELQEDIVVYSGEVPQIELVNLAEPARSEFHGGDSWAYSATRSAGNQGLDSETPYRWRIDLFHNQHSHPILVDQTVTTGTIDIDSEGHVGEWNIWFRFFLTTRTETGQEFTLYKEIFPALSTITIGSTPGSVPMIINGVTYETAHQLTAIVGTVHTVEMPALMVYQGDINTFDQWRVSGAEGQVRTITLEDRQNRTLTFTVSAANANYSAHYVYSHPADQVRLPIVKR